MSDTPPPPEPAAAPPEGASSLIGASWQDQDGTLRDLWMQNKTPQAIGDVLGRSIPAIMTRAARLGLPRRTAPGRKPGAGSTSRRLLATEGEAARMTRRAPLSSHDTADEQPQTSLRICLMCLRKFESAGRQNRICPPCKGSAEYNQASALPEASLPET